jgi:NADH dehydrogenase
MILVTGGTGFIGRQVLRRLSRFRKPVRTLLNPSKKTPNLPRGISVEVVLASESDRGGVRAALVGVDAVVFLGRGSMPHLTRDEVEAEVTGMKALAQAAGQAGVRRFLYLSALGANRASAFSGLRAKAEAELILKGSGVPYTILRTATVYGEQDRFTRTIAMLAAVSPGLMLIPGDGSTLLQPLWVDDLATCITWTLEEQNMIRTVHDIGGPEYLTLRRVVEVIMSAAGSPRIVLPTRAPYLRSLSWVIARLLPSPPVSPVWMDHISAGCTTDLNTLPSVFGLQPARFSERLGYLQQGHWGWELMRAQIEALRQR